MYVLVGACADRLHSLTTSYLGWRWVFWIMMIFAGTCTLLAFAFLPETYAPVLLLWKAQRLRKAAPEKNAELYAEHERSDWSVKGIVHRTIYRPVQMLMQEPILLLVTVYLSLVYGVLYASAPRPLSMTFEEANGRS